MQARRRKLIEGAHRTPYEILHRIYDAKGNATFAQIMHNAPFKHRDALDSLRKLIAEGFVLNSDERVDMKWRGYRITRQGRILATAYASGIVHAMRLHSKATGLDRVKEFRSEHAWLFVHDRP